MLKGQSLGTRASWRRLQRRAEEGWPHVMLCPGQFAITVRLP